MDNGCKLAMDICRDIAKSLFDKCVWNILFNERINVYERVVVCVE